MSRATLPEHKSPPLHLLPPLELRRLEVPCKTFPPRLMSLHLHRAVVCCRVAFIHRDAEKGSLLGN